MTKKKKKKKRKRKRKKKKFVNLASIMVDRYLFFIEPMFWISET